MTSFTPLAALAGGLLIGVATVLYLAFVGRYAGMSGMLRGALFGGADRRMDASFLAGLLIGGACWAVLHSHPVAGRFGTAAVAGSAIGGLLVGYGTALGGGCTSGHGVCGLGRLSLRSFVAVITFLATGVATVFVVRHVFGASA